MSKRDLILSDVSAAMALQGEKPERETYKAIERLAQETCGWRLLTILKYVEKDSVVERVSSSDEKAYPLVAQAQIREHLSLEYWIHPLDALDFDDDEAGDDEVHTVLSQ